MYNMFSEDPNEQELYHATAAVTSLLLEIGEVGKLFAPQPAKEGGYKIKWMSEASRALVSPG